MIWIELTLCVGTALKGLQMAALGWTINAAASDGHAVGAAQPCADLNAMVDKLVIACKGSEVLPLEPRLQAALNKC